MKRNEQIMKPLLKYRGGKSRELSEFRRFIPKEFDKYLEPFLGGGAVFFDIEPKNAIINDINTNLMEFYKQVRNNYDNLSNELARLQSIYETNQTTYGQKKDSASEKRVENPNEQLYYQLRDMYNGKTTSPYLYGTLYYFINKTAYCGMIRYNQQGEYNVPFGRYIHFNTKIITPQHNKLLNNSELYNVDYSEIFSLAKEKDFMFLDPPYDCVFHDYGNLNFQHGFDEAQHRRLANDFRNLNCKAMMIIGRTPLTEELYGNMVKHEYQKKYAVNIKNRFHAAATHIVITNYTL